MRNENYFSCKLYDQGNLSVFQTDDRTNRKRGFYTNAPCWWCRQKTNTENSFFYRNLYLGQWWKWHNGSTVIDLILVYDWLYILLTWPMRTSWIITAGSRSRISTTYTRFIRLLFSRLHFIRNLSTYICW